MVYEFRYEITTTAMLGLLFVYLALQKDMTKLNKGFRRLVGMTIVVSAFDMLTAFLFMHATEVHVAWLQIANFLYYLSTYFLVCAFKRYVNAYIEGQKSARLERVERILNISITALFVIMLIFNIFFGFIYNFDPAEGYQHGPAYLVVFAPIVFMIIHPIVMLFVYRKNFFAWQTIALLAFVVLLFAGMGIQIFFFENVLLTMVASAVSIFILYFTIESPNHYHMVKMTRELQKTTEELNALRKSLEIEVAEKTRELQDKSDKLDRMTIEIAESLAKTIDAKDHYTIGHSARVAAYSRLIAKAAGKSEDYQDLIFKGGLLHDIGKIGIPDNILNKPGKLDPEEMEAMRSHSAKGEEIMKSVDSVPEFALIAGGHHERYDGLGYPRKLKGEQIPEMARIVSIADSFDAMTSDRSYRKALPFDIVRAELIKGKGTQFDPEFVDVFLTLFDKAYEEGASYYKVIENLLKQN